MATRWFRVPTTGSGTLDDPYRPAYADRVDGYTWTDHDVFGGSPQRLARFYADEQTLDAIAGESDAHEVAIPIDRLNAAFGQSRDAAGWRAGFHVDTA